MLQHDVGACIKGVFAIPNTAQTAGAEAEVTGPTVDRNNLADSYHSAKLLVAVRATLASGETISIAANMQESANNSDWSDYGTALASTVVLTGASGGSSDVVAVAELDASLNNPLVGVGTSRPARRYLRAQVTPDMSRAGTDTAQISAVLVLGGSDSLPPA